MDSKKKKYFLFPKPHFKHFLFLFFFITSVIKKNAQNYFSNYQKIAIEFLKLYSYDIDNWISIIPVLIIKKRTKRKKVIVNKNDEISLGSASIDYIYYDKREEENEERDKHKGSSMKLIFIMFLSDFIAQISTIIFYIVKDEQDMYVKLTNLNSSLIINVIFIFLLSRLILHTYFFKHHYFSLIITLLCLLALVIADIFDIKDNCQGEFKWNIIYISVKVFGIILYSLEDVCAKKVFLYHYFNPYTLLLTKGVINFFNLIIFSIPFLFINLKDTNGEEKLVFSMIKNIFDDKINILFTIIFIIVSFFYTIIIYKIVDEFSPNHFVIARAIENFGLLISTIIIEGTDSENYIVLRIIMYILLIFASLIFNEFIVLNICGLSKDTKLFLNYEAEKEITMIQRFNGGEERHPSETEMITYL